MARRARGEPDRRSQPTTEFRRRGPRELGALALAAAGIFIGLALATFDRNDPTLFSGVGDTARNWMGPAGHTVALALRIALGAMSYGVPVVLFGAAALVATSASVRSPWRRLAAVPFFLAASTGLLDRLLVDAHPLSGGGALGQIVGGRMEPIFNPLGTYLILGLVGLVSVLAMTRVSIGRVLGAIGALVAGAREDAARYLAALGEWWRGWRERRAQARAERREARAAARAEAEAAAAEDERREPTVELDADADEDDVEDDEAEHEPAVISEPATLSEDAEAEEDEEEGDWEADEEIDEEVEEDEEDEEEAAAASATSVEIHTEVPEGESTEDWATDEDAAPTPRERQRKFRFLSDRAPFRLPSLALLDAEGRRTREIDRDQLLANAELLEKRLAEYGVQAKVKAVHPGPVITRYELEPAPGVKVNRIMSLADDLSLAMRAHSIRILAPVPGKAVVGIEIPNEQREMVYLKDIIGSEAFRNESLRLPIALGQDISGNPAVADMVKMPHLLIAGATGSGKSVAINTIILSFLYKANPDEVKLIMIDPKMLELNLYEGIPHLMLPVVTDMRKAALALRWAVQEMERRYKLLSKASVRNIEGYNVKVAEELARIDATPGEQQRMEEEGEEPPEKLRYIIVVIDELADMMMVASKDVEESITRLAQMARAAGIHLIVATQRPSVDVITGIIKANFPARISFKVSARHDSRVILDSIGAERLLGQGDMLMLAPGTSKVVRIHGAFVSEREIMKVTKFLRQQGSPIYDESILEVKETEPGAADDDYDEKYDEALAYVAQLGHASISLVQRRFRIGYNRAARIIEKMEREGVLGPAEGAGKPRPVLVNSYDG